MHLLPDGRILVVSQKALAFSDGVRWDTFRQSDGQPLISSSVAVDDDGQLYAGSNGGISRIDLSAGGRWHLVPTVELPAAVTTTLTSVAGFSDRWFWYGGNTVFASWRPGQPLTTFTHRGDINEIFTLGKDVYVNDQSTGRLFRLMGDGTTRQILTENFQSSDNLTCATAFGTDRLLVGTVSSGLFLFDGKTLAPFARGRFPNDGHRITDLCAAGKGFFAAAVDSVGIVFFDERGQTVQVLERALDHRLARVRRLQYTPDGVLWALLNEGVVRAEFPSPISHFDPLLAGGLTFAQPLRHSGKLWMLADGRAMRGVYGKVGRLERFDEDTPAGGYLFTMADVEGHLFACNDQGIYVYEESVWRMALPGIVKARFGVARSTPEGIYYVARGEYGIITQSGSNYSADRVSVPELGDCYNALVDSAGIGWLELGISRVGRVDTTGGKLKLRILGPREGLADGWVETYTLDGIARFHTHSIPYRFDESLGKFVEDRELVARIPQFANAGGRPVADSMGRVWYTANGTNQAIDHTASGGDHGIEVAPVGFAPTDYTAEDDGVIWMFVRGRLARLDPRIPAPVPAMLRAVITSVQFPGSNRERFAPRPVLDPLEYVDNSVIIHFAAPASPFGAPITFEVLLEGVGGHWISVGAVGSAAFNDLREGQYVFRVRPIAGGTKRGKEATLEFIVRPPWYRTPLAWTLYVLTAAGILALVLWLPSFLQRRENHRLEQLVGKRTEELNSTNLQLEHQIEETTTKSAALSVSEERFRVLNAELEGRVRERTAKLTEASGLLDAMLENSPDHIYFKDRESRFVRFSRACLKQFGLTDAEMLRGKTDRDFFATAHANSAYEDEQKIIHTGEAIVNKLEQETHVGGHTTWALTTKMPWRDGTGAIVGTFGISKTVTAWKEAEAQLAATHKQLVESSRKAGMAEVAAGVLHNVGNVLNSVNVSATLVADKIRHTKAGNIAKVAAMLGEHKTNLAGFLTTDSKGVLIPDYLTSLAVSITTEQKSLIEEIEHLRKNIEHIKEIVAMQQSHAGNSRFVETLPLVELVEDSLRMYASSLVRHEVELVRDFQIRPEICTDRHKFVQIFVNLIRNAKEACGATGRKDKRIILRIVGLEESVRIAVTDNGVGIPPENITRIFNHGFTTRENGHGFGLHSSALAARQLGGSLRVESDGPGTGATFILELPLGSNRKDPDQPETSDQS